MTYANVTKHDIMIACDPYYPLLYISNNTQLIVNLLLCDVSIRSQKVIIMTASSIISHDIMIACDPYYPLL